MGGRNQRAGKCFWCSWWSSPLSCTEVSNKSASVFGKKKESPVMKLYLNWASVMPVTSYITMWDCIKFVSNRSWSNWQNFVRTTDVRYARFPTSKKLNEKSLHYRKLIYTTPVPLFFNIMPKHIDISLPSWNKFKNSVVETGLKNTHFYFLNVVKTLTSKEVFQQPKDDTLTEVRTTWSMIHGMNSILDLLCWPVHSSRISTWPFLYSALLSDKLHSHYIITIHRYQIAVNFNGEKSFALKNQITGRISSWDRCCCRCTLPPLQVLPPTKK